MIFQVQLLYTVYWLIIDSIVLALLQEKYHQSVL